MRITLRDRLNYWFDNYMSRGMMALIGGLFMLTLFVIGTASFCIVHFKIVPSDLDSGSFNFLEAMWVSLMRTLDAGNIAGDVGWLFRIVMICVTASGIFIFSALIGVLSRGLEAKLENMRKGRSKVIESNHTIILGWSPLIFTILSELIITNECRKKSCIVIMSELDKIEMEDQIHFYIGDSKNTKIVCRRGNPIDINDLEILNIQTSKSIIIVNPKDETHDMEVIKILLAILNSSTRRVTPYHIVTRIRNSENYNVASLVGKQEVEFILEDEFTARLIAQSCFQGRLSAVYNEILSFNDNEIYIHNEPSLYGMSFNDLLVAYKNCSVIGIFNQQDHFVLNPSGDTPYLPGDQLIMIARDRSSIFPAPIKKIGRIQPNQCIDLNIEIEKKRVLIIGWNPKAKYIIKQLSRNVHAECNITVIFEHEIPDDDKLMLTRLDKEMTIDWIKGKTNNYSFLESLPPSGFNHIVVLSDYTIRDRQEADAKTIMVLLYIRDIISRSDIAPSLVSEMLDAKNCQLAEITQVDDFIVSERMISLIITQVSENKHLNAILKELLDFGGSDIYLVNADRLVAPGVSVNFYSVIGSARRMHAIPIGYKLKRYMTDPAYHYGIVINPDKNQSISYDADDQFILVLNSEMEKC